MDRDTGLFVQAFWVKCRETIRPELDLAVDGLKSGGHAVHVATQKHSDVPGRLPDAGPSVILTVPPSGSAEGHTLQLRGDVAQSDVVVSASSGTSHRHELADLEPAAVRAEISACLINFWSRACPTPSTTCSAASARPSTRPMSRRLPPASPTISNGA